MAKALTLAQQFRHTVHPNPMVGAMVVKGGKVLAQAAHERFGGPHAEVLALQRAQEAGHDVQGTTVIITLEPCSHHGKTPPCAEALAAAGVGEVIYAVGDPNPKVNGRGAALLEKAGITVKSGVLAREAIALNRGFFKRITTGLPWVTMKTAQTLDGKLTDARGEGQWITGEASRAAVMDLRHGHDAVLVGTGTLLADDPQLTVRPAQGQVQPVRAALDLNGRLTAPPALLADDPQRAWLLTTEGTACAAHGAFAKAGGRVIALPAKETDLRQILERLGTEGLNTVLVEAGPRLATALLVSGLVDEWHAFVAPIVLGGGGDVFAPPAPPALKSAPRFHTLALHPHPRGGETAGVDVQWVLRRQRA